MKFFSNKNRKRFLTLLVGGVMCASTAAGVSELVGTEAADADVYAKPTTTKIETLVDSWSDLGGTNQYGLKKLEESGWPINTTNSAMTSTNRYALAVYNQTGHNDNNPVDYEGNVGIWYDIQKTKDNTASTASQANVGFKLRSSAITSNGGYGIISFRTKWTTGNGTMSLGMLVPTATGYTRWADNGNNGYWIALQESAVQIVEFQGKTSVAFVSDATYTNTPTNGENLIVTYGVWQSAETARSIYLKVEKEDGTVCYENTVVDSDITNNTVTENGTFAIAKGEGSYDKITADPVLLVAGVDEPLMKNTALTENKKFAVGTSLANVTLSNTAYALVGTEGAIAEGTNKYDVKIANYYGKATGKVGTVSITSRADYSVYSQYTENLETLVNGRADVSVGPGANLLIHGTTSTSAYWNCDMFSAGQRKIAFYDDAAKSNGLLDFDGNVLVTTDYTSTTGNIAAAFQYNGQTAYAENNGNGYGIISFRTKYATSGGYLSLGMMINKGSYILADKNANNGYGYWFKVAVDGTISALKYTDSSTNVDITSADTAFEVKPVDGDDLIISYGVLKTSETVNTLYLKIEKVNADNSLTLCYEGIHVDNDSSTVRLHTELAQRVFQFSFGASASKLTANSVLLVAGVDEPLYTTNYAEKYSLVDTDYEVNEDEALPTLPSGYTWVDTTAVFGTSEYAANYSFDYYGKTVSVPVAVEVSVISQRVTLQLMKGDTELYSTSIKVGDTVDFGSLTLQGVNTIIGWTKSENTDLLRADMSFTATEEMVDTTVVYNVVDMDMKQYEKASIRTTVDENGEGGLRFIAMLNTADLTANREYILGAYGVIVPADDATYYTAESGFTQAALNKYALEEKNLINKTAYTAADFDIENAEQYSIYTIVLTNIQYHNYNRTFASMTYITVEYADGTTMNFETNVAMRSIYEIALAAKAAQIESGETLYSNQQMKVIGGYITNVIDVVFDVEAESKFTVVDREDHKMERPYELTSSTYDASTKEVTLTFTVSEDSLLAKNTTAPVWVSMVGDDATAIRYKATVSYVSGTATVTFTMQ